MHPRSVLHAFWVFPWPALLFVTVPSRALADVRVGVEIGMNYSSVNYHDVPAFYADAWDLPGWRPSFTGGATVQVPMRGKFDLVTGLRYVQQGNRVKFEFDPQTVGEFRLYMDYLSVPALLTYHPSAKRGFFVALGPEIAVLLGAHTIIERSNLPSSYIEDRHRLDKANVTADAAAGYEFPVDKHVGMVSVRYTHGLMGVAKEGFWLTDWNTRGFEFLLGMRW